MNVISLKHFKATDILKNVENKIKNNIEITDEDIAALQLIAYTTYSKSKLELLKKTYKLVRKLPIEPIEKEAIQYILDVLSTNLLTKEYKDKLMENNNMMINPREEYFMNKGKIEGIETIAKNLIKD